MNGGQILLGVEDDGTISGVRRGSLQAWVMDTVIGRCVVPPIIPDYEEVAMDGGKVAVIDVPAGKVANPWHRLRSCRPSRGHARAGSRAIVGPVNGVAPIHWKGSQPLAFAMCSVRDYATCTSCNSIPDGGSGP